MTEIVNLDEKRAQLKAAQEDEDVLCTVIIRASSRVTVWLSDRVSSEEQTNWLHAKMANATTIISDLTEGFP